MKIKVVSTIVLDTEKISKVNTNVKNAIERESRNKGSDRIGRLWAWDEARKQDAPDITLEILSAKRSNDDEQETA